jgi:hypothetical protein
MAVRDAAPPAPVSVPPVLAGFPAAIARAGLGAVDAGGGSSTVTFPAPGGSPEHVPFSTAPMTVSRSIFDDARSAVTGYAEDALSDAGAAVRERATEVADSATSAATGAVASALPGASSSGAADDEEQFAKLLERLKRELTLEKEWDYNLSNEP